MTNRLYVGTLPFQGTEAVIDKHVSACGDLHPVAIALGEAWAHELAHSLRSVEREIIGGWPGTMREARNRVRVAMRTKLELRTIDELARVAYRAARRGWQKVSEPDSEP